MSLKKIFSLVIPGIAFLLFINTFLPFYSTSWASANLWRMSKSISVFILLSAIAVAAVYILYFLGILKEKLVSYGYLGIGFLGLFHIAYFFDIVENGSIGLWFGLILSLGLIGCSIVWNFLSDTPLPAKPKPVPPTPITPNGMVAPQQPVNSAPVAPAPVTQPTEPVVTPEPSTPAPAPTPTVEAPKEIAGYDPQTGAPIYK